jgi:hypothetical protein
MWWGVFSSTQIGFGGRYETLGLVCTLTIFGFAAFVWLIPGIPPASDRNKGEPGQRPGVYAERARPARSAGKFRSH